jgi:hypothetical protein
MSKCPGNQTSPAGASSIASCYCPVGFVLKDGILCVPFHCPQSPQQQQLARPGASYISRYYLALVKDVTTCVACPENSFSVVNGGVGVQSCVPSSEPSGPSGAKTCRPFVASCAAGGQVCSPGFVYDTTTAGSPTQGAAATGSSVYTQAAWYASGVLMQLYFSS